MLNILAVQDDIINQLCFEFCYDQLLVVSADRCWPSLVDIYGRLYMFITEQGPSQWEKTIQI